MPELNRPAEEEYAVGNKGLAEDRRWAKTDIRIFFKGRDTGGLFPQGVQALAGETSPTLTKRKSAKSRTHKEFKGHIYKLNTWLDSETEILKNMPENPIKSRSICNYFYTRPKAHMQDDVVLVFKTFINPTLRNEQINWDEYDRWRIQFTYPLSRLPENLFRELTEYLVNPSDSNTTNPVHDDALINFADRAERVLGQAQGRYLKIPQCIISKEFLHKSRLKSNKQTTLCKLLYFLYEFI